MTAVLTPDALREIRARAHETLTAGYWATQPGPIHAALGTDVPALCDEVTRLRAALEEITRRDGPLPNLDMDDPRMPLHHAHNVIENMAGIAGRALGGAET